MLIYSELLRHDKENCCNSIVKAWVVFAVRVCRGCLSHVLVSVSTPKGRSLPTPLLGVEEVVFPIVVLRGRGGMPHIRET